MYIKYAVHGLLLWATVTSAFNPYVKPDKSKPKIGSVGGSHKVWKPLKAPRDAKPFLPVEEKPVDMKKMKPMKELQLKKIPRAVCYPRNLASTQTQRKSDIDVLLGQWSSSSNQSCPTRKCCYQEIPQAGDCG